MKLSCDASGLEWNVAAYLAQDKIAIQEIKDGFDLHADNQHRLGLPDRRIAKIFLFRLIYGGTAGAYAHDTDFNWISRDRNWWQQRVDSIYRKYTDLGNFHTALEHGVMESGYYESPSGRVYQFKPYQSGRGDWRWPRTTILNYPVQGLAADIVMLIRVELARRLKRGGYKSLLVNTIHDSIDVDALSEEWYNISIEMKDTFEHFPEFFKESFGAEYNIPLRCEIKLNGEKV